MNGQLHPKEGCSKDRQWGVASKVGQSGVTRMQRHGYRGSPMSIEVQVLCEPGQGHLPCWPRVALQEVLIGVQRGRHAQLLDSASPLSTSGNLWVTRKELVDLPQKAYGDRPCI